MFCIYYWLQGTIWNQFQHGPVVTIWQLFTAPSEFVDAEHRTRLVRVIRVRAVQFHCDGQDVSFGFLCCLFLCSSSICCVFLPSIAFLFLSFLSVVHFDLRMFCFLCLTFCYMFLFLTLIIFAFLFFVLANIPLI